ncbi:MAG: hypothetical protein COA86_07950 [Kangiella sp.]|nr:MAG: hypothetical protein COA86_07950 [Kangiella sp.]
MLILTLAVIYAVSGQLGLYLQGETRGITTLWPPTGVAVFFIYRFGYRVWPGILLGLFGVAYVLGESVPYSPFLMLLISILSILEASLITYFLKRNNFSPFFLKINDLNHLFFWGILLFPGLNALFGSGLFYFNGYVSAEEWPISFFGWWLGNSMGLLMLVPMAFIWSWYPSKYYKQRNQKLIELAIISCVAIYILLFNDLFDKENQFQLFFSFLLIIFCSIRYLHHGATIISLILSISIILQNRPTDGIALEMEKVIDQEIFIALIYMTGFYISTVLKQHMEVQRNYFREKTYAETILNSIYDSVIVTDSKGIILSVNPSAEKILAQTESKLIDMPITNAMHLKLGSTQENLNPVLLDGIQNNIQNFPEKEIILVAGGKSNNVELYLSQISIKHKQLHFAVSHHLYKLNGCVITIRNVNHSHELKEQLRYQASHDYLTGLVNRRDFENQLVNIINSKEQSNYHHVLLFIDLDRFKVVNDTSGHIAGDQILKSASHVLEKTLRKNDLLARIGGGEFGVLLTNCNRAKGLEIAENLRKAIDNFNFKWGENQYNLGASIGLTTIDDQTVSMEDAMRKADIACYEAKDSGKNNVFIYQGSQNSKRETDMLWLSRISQAIDKQQFELYVQPIVFCQSLQTSHYEILLRLKLENDEIISPAEFIPVAERNGAMAKIDKWVVETSIQWLKDNPLRKINLAINLSGASLGDNDFCEYLKAKISDSALAKNQLCFEITETSAIRNYETAQYFMKCSKEFGVSFALDDFGSGLSSFSYLKSFPVDYLKIDGSFVKEMVHNPIDRAMVKSIHEVGKVMGIKTIAEFVEDYAIIESCRSLGIDYLQGYGISKPFPLSKI